MVKITKTETSHVCEVKRLRLRVSLMTIGVKIGWPILVWHHQLMIGMKMKACMQVLQNLSHRKKRNTRSGR